MWDQIKVTLPDATHAPEVLGRMQSLLEEKTAQDTEEAESEWQSATRQNGLSQFSAKPSVELRPAASGVDIIVRFVTRASQRFGLRSRLYEAILPLLETPKPEPTPAPDPAPKPLARAKGLTPITTDAHGSRATPRTALARSQRPHPAQSLRPSCWACGPE